MKDWLIKFIMVLVLLGIPLFTALSFVSDSIQFTGLQKAFFISLSFFEALAFEAGILSLFFLLPNIKTVGGKLGRHLKMMYYPLLWLLMSWWPHDYFHSHNDHGTWGLISIEYTFHLTSIFAAAIAIYGLSYVIQDFLEKS